MVGNSIYIVRDAAFGQAFGPKLVAALLGLLLVAWDRRSQHRWDYLWVYLAGTLIWGGVELAMQTGGVRQMQSHMLFGRELAPVLAQLIQGAAEGATFAVLALFVADRWLVDPRRPRPYMLFAIFSLALFASSFRAHRGGGSMAVASRRDILDPVALLVLALLVVGSVYVAWRYAGVRRRMFAMFVVMLGLGFIWTISQLLVGGRWVEVGDAAAGSLQRAGPALTTAVLGYDIVFEIAAVYLPFLALPTLLGLIPRTSPGESVRHLRTNG